MKNIAYYNGKTAPIEEMMVPMNDRACYFGDGVYDATCVVNHVPMAFDDHIDRIYRSAKLIDIEIPMEKAEMKALLQGLVDQVEGDVLFLYWQVTRGVGMRNHPYAGAGDKPSLWAFVRPSKMRDPFGVYKCITVEDKRFFYCNIKTINLLPAVMANEKAMEAGDFPPRRARDGMLAFQRAHSQKRNAVYRALRRADSAGYHPRAHFEHLPAERDSRGGRAVHAGGNDGGGRNLLLQLQRADLPHRRNRRPEGRLQG